MTAILLAAGSATRFGSQKLLARLPDGRRVVEASIANLRAAGLAVCAVTSADPDLISVLQSCDCEIVVNADARDGMGTSIAAGVAAGPTSMPGAHHDGWLVALGDMPFIRPATIALIWTSLKDAQAIAQPLRGEQRGHPVGFGAAYRDQLAALTGDEGARSVVAVNKAHLQLINTDDPGVIADIDTPEDLARGSNLAGR